MKIYTEYGESTKCGLIHVEAELTINSVVEFENHWLQLSKKNPKVIGINLSKVEFIDSTGVGSCVKMLKAIVAKSTAIVFVDISPSVRELLKSSNLLGFFTIISARDFELKYPIR